MKDLQGRARRLRRLSEPSTAFKRPLQSRATINHALNEMLRRLEPRVRMNANRVGLEPDNDPPNQTSRTT
ncbi:MAG: hypothetical protein ACK57N_01715 [Planctomycetia bacterium]